MILINIDSLSTTELQYIAQQERLSNWQSLDREELIDALEEAFGEQDDELPSAMKGKINRNRYCNALTDFRGNKQHINGLPGVEDLPESYLDTSIHLLLRDPQWAFAYWSLSPASNLMIFGEDGQEKSNLFLRVQETNLSTKGVRTFDISISLEDTQWNINLPNIGSSYVVDLCWRDKKGNEMSLAQSKSVETFPSYWQEHVDELAMDGDLFTMHFSSLVTREGEIVDNAVLREIAQTLSKGVL
ncbi:hypothetical protein SDC9_77832 [bioreactor metagenome]|jgi:hypothetical protein|uniref:DUF4912 domain-containing protein n=1 Tax=bioreactor metagenome TaxID=1076179 RepID=A0A644YSJ1_9ZZZZ|nr:DUF4912 domain-containing protein [Sphaerochaeta sp.]